MVTIYRSTEMEPRARGREFGNRFAAKVKANVETYGALFTRFSGGGIDIPAAGKTALAATAGFAPALHEEMLGIAEGAGVDPVLIGALNARTEILAMAKAATRGECSAVIHLTPELTAPVAHSRPYRACLSRYRQAHPRRGPRDRPSRLGA